MDDKRIEAQLGQEKIVKQMENKPVIEHDNDGASWFFLALILVLVLGTYLTLRDAPEAKKLQAHETSLQSALDKRADALPSHLRGKWGALRLVEGE